MEVGFSKFFSDLIVSEPLLTETARWAKGVAAAELVAAKLLAVAATTGTKAEKDKAAKAVVASKKAVAVWNDIDIEQGIYTVPVTDEKIYVLSLLSHAERCKLGKHIGKMEGLDDTTNPFARLYKNKASKKQKKK